MGDKPDTTAADSAPQPSTGPEQAPAATELEQLRQQLQQAQDEARASQERFLRERAELENFKKRTQREMADALRFASEPLIRDLLPVIDNLERALEHANGDPQSVVEGIRLVLKSLLDILERHGVKRLETLGERFDPSRHQAMAQIESAEHEPNRVVQQHHTGYLLHDRLLRPALVTVSKPKSADAVESGPQSD